jgi:hypothetical protein
VTLLDKMVDWVQVTFGAIGVAAAMYLMGVRDPMLYAGVLAGHGAGHLLGDMLFLPNLR